MSNHEISTTPVVSTVDRIGPTHARELKPLVGMHCSIRQGEPLHDMRLDFDLSCGAAPVRIDDQHFELALRTCFVSLSRENCVVIPNSGYAHNLDTGKFKSSEVQKSEALGSAEAGGGLDFSADGISAIGGLFKAKIGGQRKKTNNVEAHIEKDERVVLVSSSGQDRWCVGDRVRGDARRSDGLLSGDYFNELRGSDEEALPLCRLQWERPSEPMGLTLTVTGSISSIVALKPGQSIAAGIDAIKLWTTLKRRGARAAHDHEERLKAYVAGFAVAKKIRHAQESAGLSIPDGEFVILKLSLCPHTEAQPESNNQSANDE
jgi:hypothetical protein